MVVFKRTRLLFLFMLMSSVLPSSVHGFWLWDKAKSFISSSQPTSTRSTSFFAGLTAVLTPYWNSVTGHLVGATPERITQEIESASSTLHEHVDKVKKPVNDQLENLQRQVKTLENEQKKHEAALERINRAFRAEEEEHGSHTERIQKLSDRVNEASGQIQASQGNIRKKIAQIAALTKIIEQIEL